MSRALRDPRVRAIVVVAVVLLAVALGSHVLVTGFHGTAMMLGLCVAVLAVAATILVPGGPMLRVALFAAPAPSDSPREARVEPTGRYPPDEGIALRH